MFSYIFIELFFFRRFIKSKKRPRPSSPFKLVKHCSHSPLKLSLIFWIPIKTLCFYQKRFQMSRESKVHHGKVGNVSRSWDFQQNVTLYFKTCSYKLNTCSACPKGKSAKTVIYYKWLMTGASFTHTSDGMLFHKKIIRRRPVGGWGLGWGR